MKSYACLDRSAIHSGGWNIVLPSKLKYIVSADAGYLYDVLLPTFKGYRHSRVDRQFELDFKRAAALADRPAYAASWNLNGKPLVRRVGSVLRFFNTFHTSSTPAITAIYNQRAGIDLVRRISELSCAAGCIAMPRNDSFKLDLKLSKQSAPRVFASAIIALHTYSEAGEASRTPKLTFRAAANYNLNNGKVLYLFKQL